MGDLTVNLALESDKTIIVPYTEETCAEDVCICICKRLKIGPLARHLFALRVAGENIFLMPSAKVEDLKDRRKEVDFRVRFKMSDFDKLSKRDSKAYEYLFHQFRFDVLENKVDNLTYEKCRDELSGLAVMDMYRYMREKRIPKETVLKDYKKFLPKEVLKRHNQLLSLPFQDNLKRKINSWLEKMLQTNVDTKFVIKEYVNQLLNIAPHYLIEVYNGKMQLRLDDGEPRPYRVSIRMCPKNGLQYTTAPQTQKWESIGHITDISTITLSVSQEKNEDKYHVVINHKNGSPFLLWCYEKEVYSFVSVLDGYFRLSVDWTMNICKEVETPSLKKLKKMRCHAPVGGEYSYAKIRIRMEEQKKNCYLVRECESNHDSYYIDVCVKNSTKPSSFKIQKLSDDHYIFDPDKDATKYDSIAEIVKAYSIDKNKEIYLEDCIGFPTSPEISQVLLCRSDSIVGDSLDLSEQVKLPSGPICIYKEHLQQFKASRKQGSRGYTSVYKGMWRYTPGRKIEVAIKVLEESNENYLKEYLNLLGHWAFLENPAIVKLHGIYLTSTASVWQYCKHASLGEFLRTNRDDPEVVDQRDLVVAARDLASALFYLYEKKLVHGKIRCRKIMVHSTPNNKFIVRLADPGIRTYYVPSEIHWLPVECYATQHNMQTHIVNQDYVKKSIEADVWALATTYYEIFSWGDVLDTKDFAKHMKWYWSGERLKKPQDCPLEIYKLMRECWNADPYKRKHPQELLRDMNNYYYVHVHQWEHRTNVYNTITESINIEAPSDTEDEPSSIYDPDDQRKLLNSAFGTEFGSEFDIQKWCGQSNISSNSTSLSTLTISEALPISFELGSDWNVVLEGKAIGSGNFAEVYKARMEPYIPDLNKQTQIVAVKKLKAGGLYDVNMADFEREINIMKSLSHRNIIRIMGVQREPDVMLVMEYVDNGSLDRYLSAYKDQLFLPDLLKFAEDIASGMEYLGSINPAIVHRDLAARNVLVKERDHVKISDFGLAQFTATGSDYYRAKTINRELPIKSYALESLQMNKYSVKSDVWSYGVTLCEIFQYGQQPELIEPLPPGKETEETGLFIQALVEGKRFPAPRGNWPRNIYVELIYPCWNKDPHKRPSFTELKAKIRELENILDI